MTLPYRVTILTLTVLLGNSTIAQTAPHFALELQRSIISSVALVGEPGVLQK